MTWNSFCQPLPKKFVLWSNLILMIKIECWRWSIICWKESQRLKITLSEDNFNLLWPRFSPFAMIQDFITEYQPQKEYKSLKKQKSSSKWLQQMELHTNFTRISGNCKSTWWILINLDLMETRKKKQNSHRRRKTLFTKLSRWFCFVLKIWRKFSQKWFHTWTGTHVIKIKYPY